MLASESTLSGGPLSTEKTALVVVHGVADQLPGATAKSIVDLLVATSPPGAAYRSLGSRDLTLSVPPLAPCFEAKRVDVASPHALDRSLFQSFLQSYRSDFQRQRWEAPTAGQVLAERKAAKSAAAPSSSVPAMPAALPADTTAVAAVGRSPTTCSASNATTAACRKPTRPPASSSSASRPARLAGSRSTRCTGPTCRGSRARFRAS